MGKKVYPLDRKCQTFVKQLKPFADKADNFGLLPPALWNTAGVIIPLRSPGRLKNLHLWVLCGAVKNTKMNRSLIHRNRPVGIQKQSLTMFEINPAVKKPFFFELLFHLNGGEMHRLVTQTKGSPVNNQQFAGI